MRHGIFSILTAAALLSGCGDNTDKMEDSYLPPTENEPVVMTNQNSGNFNVDSRSETGATFENKTGQEARIAFTARGQWRFAPAGGLLGPAGVAAPAPDNYLLPKANSFSLIVKRGSGTFQSVGDGVELVLTPDEVISFMMNDIVNGASDNEGTLNVTWTRR